MMAIYSPKRKFERGGGGGVGLLRNWVERGKKKNGELVVVTGLTFLCLPFYDFLCSFSFPLLVKN